ncbi:MAG: 4Fe-4S dicluster domain-containing protein [Geosporobacter ferrireducens]|nr:4Fe-4S dicluster domain-containing protein [Geosporobacter ferrireducens]
MVEKNGFCYNTNIQRKNNFEEDIHMAYVILDSCISCGACEPECPVNVISAGDDKYVIDQSGCIDCGACANVCPVDAPVQE